MAARLKIERGASLLELALLLPIFGLLLLWGQTFFELLLSKLKVQQMSRLVAWDIARVPLSDYAKGEHALTWAAAQKRAMTDANEVLPRAQSGLRFGWLLKSTALSLTSTGRKGRAADTGLDVLGFNPTTEVEAEASVEIWPLGVKLVSRHALSVETWMLPDGADAVIANGRAGNHSSGQSASGLYLQVERMHRAALGPLFSVASTLSALQGAWPIALPQFFGTFVVSRNYGPLTGKPCPGIPGYPDAQSADRDARSGLSDGSQRLDHVRPACFDTAPFRDTQRYQSSLYAQQFVSRGHAFMACQRPEADDPSVGRDVTVGDAHLSKTDCEGLK